MISSVSSLELSRVKRLENEKFSNVTWKRGWEITTINCLQIAIMLFTWNVIEIILPLKLIIRGKPNVKFEKCE